MIFKNKKGAIAISQILLLVLGIVAISFAIGSSIGTVSADDGDLSPEECGKKTDATDLHCKNYCTSIAKKGYTGGTCDIEKEICICTPKYNKINEKEKSPPTGSNTNDPASKQETGENQKTTLTKDAWETAKSLYAGGKLTEETINAVEKAFKGKDSINLEDVPGLKEEEKSLIEKLIKEETRVTLKNFIQTVTGQLIFNSIVTIGIGASVRSFAVKHGQSYKQANSLGLSAASFYYTTKTVKYFIKRATKKFTKEYTKEAGKQVVQNILSKVGIEGVGWLSPTLFSFGVGAAVSVAIFLATYRKRAFEVVAFNCNVWDAQKGGNDCEKCNQGSLPCTEYQCRSLGRSCELINVGTEKELCAYVGRNDTKYPVITPSKNALLDDYTYSPLETISPQDTGVFVKYKNNVDGCVPAFTNFAFGINLDEPAKCKLSLTRENNFESMGNTWFSNGANAYNHTYESTTSSADVIELENSMLENGGEYNIYVRCEDSAGNSNPASFVFKFCTDPSPDLTPPKIVTADPLNQAPVLYDLQSTPVNVYTNKPSDCKWSRTDTDYANMENTMTCAQDESEINAQKLFKCSTTLNGLKNEQENKFYFRCKSYPGKEESQRVAMEQSYEYVLFGTRLLEINSVSPDGETIKDYTDSVKVILEASTSSGYDEGRAMCSYSEDKENYIIFFGDETFENYEHSQELYLTEGEYEYSIKCVDLGGNTETETIDFNVEVDTEAPQVVRIYKDGGDLALVTDEEAKCVYNTAENVGCSYSFDDALPMTSTNDLKHETNWKSNTNFYIKCKDLNGVGPATGCSVIVRPFDL